MNVFIDEHRSVYGVEPICKVMQVAPSSYWLHAQRRDQPELRPVRAQRDEQLIGWIDQVWQANLQVYGAPKVWRQLHRDGVPVAHCTVERLMRRRASAG